MPSDSPAALRVCVSVVGVAVMHQLWKRLVARSGTGAGAVATARAVHVRAALARPAPAFVGALSEATVVGTAAGQAPRKLIGTHDGAFHCDEALACAMLKMLPEYADAVVVRTRDPKELEACCIVVDVGAEYDHARRRLDHHQKGFTDTMQEIGHKIKLSSAGLVYRHFGSELVAQLAKAVRSRGAQSTAAELDAAALYRRVYKSFIEHVDGIDNGIEANAGEKNYEITTTLSDRVGALNPRWNEPCGPEDSNTRFRAAMELAGGEFAAAVEDAANSWWPARALVMEALDSAAAIHPSRQVVELTQGCPWESHLFGLEEERAAAGDKSIAGTAKYIVFPDSKSGWRVRAVPVEEGSFSSRKGLPEAWRGVRDQKLSDLTGIEGCVFVHAGGFIGGHSTREGALAMAVKAIAF